MMAVRAPIPISLTSGVSSASFPSALAFVASPRSPEMASHTPDMSAIAQSGQVQKQSPKQHVPSTARPKSTPTISGPHASNSEDVRIVNQALNDKPHSPSDAEHTLASPSALGSLKIDTEKSASYDTSLSQEEEPPASVIHAPIGFGNFSPNKPNRNSSPATFTTPVSTSNEMGSKTALSTISSNSAASAVTVTRLVGDNQDATERVNLIPPPPLLTQIPTAPEWTKTPRAQTRRDLGMASQPSSSLPSLASISESDDDELDPAIDSSSEEIENVELKSPFYRDDDEDLRTLEAALTECWTLCNTLAGLSYVHREKIFSKKGNTQQQAWRSCWRLCQNLYDARNESAPMHVRTTLDLCREFCQALFDVRARGDDTSDSVLRVSFELNNHLFNVHDRSLPEAFSERTLDFYITLCHRLMKQRISIEEETSSLLRACWALAEMLFSIRQTKREGRRADEDLLSSAVQACWELCDLFRDGWTRIRPDRQTPRPSQVTLTQAFQQARKVVPTIPEQPLSGRFLPETPTTIFEDIGADSPYESSVPNIVVLGPGDINRPSSVASSGVMSSQHPRSRQSPFHWPGYNSESSVTTLSIRSGTSQSHHSSLQTVRSPSEDPNMALLKSMFVRAAMTTRRGFSPLASTSITTVSSSTSLPLFVKSLPEIAFGSQAWQMSLLDNYRKAVANDPTFRTLGVAANPTLLGLDGNEDAQVQIKIDTAQAVQAVVNGNFGWTWLKDLFRFSFGGYVEDVLNGVGG